MTLTMKNKSQGFTLPELLVVVLIIAILATIGYPSYQRYVRKTRLESVRSELLINAQNLERYYAQHATVKAEAGNPSLPPLVQNQYFNISIFNFEGPDDNDKKIVNSASSRYILEAKPTDEYKSTETCSVYLNSDGIFWASNSKNNEDCPGFEPIRQE